MNITKIKLSNFRNFQKFELKNLKKINLIIGNNGTGKTSIIESIYICSVGKSFRTSNDNNIVNKEKNNYKINLQLENKNKIKKLDFLYNEYGKTTKVNYNLKKKLTDFIGNYNVLLFSPDEIKIIKGSPKNRRNYFNIQISQFNKNYLKKLTEYNKVLKNRNEYLKNNSIDRNYLKVLDDLLIKNGKIIYEKRKEYIELLNQKIRLVQKQLKFPYQLELKYISDFSSDYISKKYEETLKKDILYGMTKIGIHRDEIEFLCDGSLAKDYASQGQQKMILLIMKIAETKIFLKNSDNYPILLLDDLFSELDISNQQNVINNLVKKTQIFITTTDVKNITNIENINIINLNELEVME